MMFTLITVLGLVFVAEMGDKTQLVAMAFAAKYSPGKVLAGVTIAVAFLNIIAVALGSFVTSIVPIDYIRIAAAVIFIAFGIFNLRDGEDEEKERSFKLGAVATVALTFFIGELGDKTQLMTITLAAQYHSPYMVLLGSILGMVAADSLGIVLGTTVFRKIPAKAVKIVSSGIFLFFGSLGLYNSLPKNCLTPVSITLYILVLMMLLYLVHRFNAKTVKGLKSDIAE